MAAPVVPEEALPMISSFAFPPPHRLGTTSGIRLSKSSPTNLTAVPSDTLAQLSSSLGLRQTGPIEQVASVDEPDSGTAVKTKKPASSRTKGQKDKTETKTSIVATQSGKPLDAFALFLPPNIPKAIYLSRPSLLEFIKSTATTYLSLWELASKLDVLDLRMPPPYVEQVCQEYDFLTQLLSGVFEKLQHVRSVGKLYLPQIQLTTETKINDILEALSETSTSVGHLFLPIVTLIQKSDLTSFDYKAIASFFRKTGIGEITLVSSDEVVREFRNKLHAEAKKLKKATIKVNYTSRDMGLPGPSYITELGKKPQVGEAIDPQKLVGSLNVTSAQHTVKEGAKTRQSTTRSKELKGKAKGAFSTDCTYSEEAALDSDGPFASEIWNLSRLHEDGIDGSGLTIAVIDSGISYTHPAFKGKILAVRNFVAEEIDDVDCAIDSDGHGTLCAGIAAGNSFYCPLNSSDPKSPCLKLPPGVAPGAKLVVCKVVKTSNGDVDSEAFLEALKWIRELNSSSTATKVDVVSISLASTYYSQERARVISDLTSTGVIVVCCASNVGRMRLQPIAFPARLGHVLCIGAHDENGKPTSFSPVGRELDFLAPGDNIWGPGPGTVGPFAMDCGSGTSCATPAVAGLVCIILHAISRMCDSNPKELQIGGKPLIELAKNVWVMRELLKEMSSSPGHHSEEIGYGTLNPYRILDRSPEEIMRVINEIIEDE